MSLVEIFLLICKFFYLVINVVLRFLLYPFVLLKSYIVGRINDHAEKHPSCKLQHAVFTFSHIFPYVLLIGAGLYLLIFLFSMKTADREGYLFWTFMLNTACGKFSLELPSYLSLGIPFDWVSICTTVLPGFFVSFFVSALKKKQYNQEEGYVTLVKASTFLRIVAVVVFTLFVSTVAMGLNSVSGEIGLWISNTFAFLTQLQGEPFFAIVGKILGLIVLGYGAILMALIAIKEIGETIFFGIVYFVVYLILVVVLGIVFDIVLGISTAAFVTNLSFFLILIFECSRHYIAETFMDEHLT